MVRATLAAAALILAACAAAPRVQTVTVKVPVEIARTPPRELLECVTQLEAPKWVGSTDPAVSSCLTPAGERTLTRLVDRVMRCEEGWRAWATEPAGANP